jgi:hypothetical protein
MTRGQKSAVDPSHYIESLASDCPMRREAAAITLGGLGHPRASRPLAGLLLREVAGVERTGEIEHEDVLRAGTDAIRRLHATDSLYAVMKVVCTLGHTEVVERVTVESLVECLAEVGGFSAVRETADKLVKLAREEETFCPGMETVGMVIFDRLSLCGDAGIKTLERLARTGPAPLKPLAGYALSMV